MNPKQFLSPAIRYFIALLFLFSAFVKTLPIQSFELTIVAQGLADWNAAPFLSRIILALEFFIGLAFLQKRFLKYLFVPGALLLLLVFNLHLAYMMMSMQNIDNCGCFGQALPMTPLQAILKNLVMMGMLFALYFLKGSFAEGEKPFSYQLMLPAALYAFVLGSMFIIFPLENVAVQPEEEPVIIHSDSLTTTDKPDTLQEKLKDTVLVKSTRDEKGDTITLATLFQKKNSLYTSFREFIPAQTLGVNDGRVIVGVFSLDCDHCQRAASEIISFRKKFGQATPRLYALFFGTEDQVSAFFASAGGEFPYTILPPEKFFPLLTSAPPRVTFMINGNVILDRDADGYQKDEFEKLIRKYATLSE